MTALDGPVETIGAVAVTVVRMLRIVSLDGRPGMSATRNSLPLLGRPMTTQGPDVSGKSSTWQRMQPGTAQVRCPTKTARGFLSSIAKRTACV